ELGAIYGRPLRAPEPAPPESAGGPSIEVEIRDPDLCWRYVARCLDGLRVGPAPAWMQRRLRAVGQRPINNVVDAANYVLLELGQPLHTFDRDRVSGGIVVRRAAAGETLLCLDGRTRELSSRMLVIADSARPVALAGIIGGTESGVGEATTRVVIESATFSGASIRATSRALGLRTEASSRFEKQLHPALAACGAARLAELLREVAGSEAGGAAVDAYPKPVEQPPIRLREGFVAKILGAEVPEDEVAAALTRLGSRVDSDGRDLIVTPPAYRLDVAIPEDLVEELGRL